MLQKITNLVLRASSIGVRFLFIFFLSKKFSLEFLGEYSLWNTTITLSLLLVGYDFYIYSTRELLSKTKSEQPSILRDQFIFIGFSYLIFIPLLCLIFYFEILESELFYYFISVLIMEHIGMEIYRITTSLEKPIFSNFLLFIRNALWIIVISLYWFITDITSPSIKDILIFWAFFALISNILGITSIIKFYNHQYLSKINWGWIKNGLGVSSKLFVATIALKTIELSDRYMIDYFLGKEQLGVFAFYYQLSNLINVVIFTTVTMMLYPKLFKNIFEKSEFSISIRNKMLVQSILIWLTLSIFIILAVPYLLVLLDKPEVSSFSSIIYLMIMASLFFNLYTIYKLVLNAYKKDTSLVVISIIAALFNILINIVYLEDIGIYIAAASSLFSYFFMAIATFMVERKTHKYVS